MANTAAVTNQVGRFRVPNCGMGRLRFYVLSSPDMDRRLRFGLIALAVLTLAGLKGAAQTPSPDWTRFRGPNGSGISTATNVPTEFGPTSNLLWRLELPTGHSSPILFGDRIYVTGVRERTLTTFAVDRARGQILWEKPAPAEARPPADKRNNPASPSVAVDANGVYVFFPDYGLVAYDT